MAEHKNTTAEESPQTVVLLESEWTEIENCAMALHAVIACGVEDEGFEVLRSVGIRFSRAIDTVRQRLWPTD